jgi:uncharacterized protein YlxW (UPF0749 family)
MLMRIEKTLITVLLLFVSKMLQASNQNSSDNQLPGAATAKSMQSNVQIRQRVTLLSAQAHELAERLLSSPSINEKKK